MGKLGKNARKFAKKNLQSVLRNQRKLKSKFKRKASKKYTHHDHDDIQEQIQASDIITNTTTANEEIEQDTSLDALFPEEDYSPDDDSDTDAYLSEGDHSTLAATHDQNQKSFSDTNAAATSLSGKNTLIFTQLLNKQNKLNTLKQKDQGFSKFLKSYEYLDIEQPMNDDNAGSPVGKMLTSASVDSLCILIKEQHSVSALTRLINAYRAACHSDSKATAVNDGIQTSDTLCKILMFMLHEADTIFRKLLGIQSSSSRKEAVLDLKNTTKWLSIRPLVKSYLRSTMFLLNQVTDSEILAFSISRLRASVIFLAAFPSLLHKLLKIFVRFWATGDGSLSSHSFLIIRDIASVCSSDWLDLCFVKTYKAFINLSQSVELRMFEHTHILRSSFVELCCLDVHKSSNKAMICVRHLGKILQMGLQTKKKEVVQKICSWQYVSCIDLWVTFISENIHDYDIQPLLYMIIQIINGVALLFPGPRYLPLRLRCIKWLNHLAGSSGVFIPVSSLVLDVLEYNITEDGGKPGKVFESLSTLKLPKHWLKSREFQEECVSSTIELLSEHFSQWSYHVSFPELATAPLILLKKIVERTSIESFKRVIKRFVDQVEMNVNFVQKKRDEVPFSPKDLQSAESFLQVEKRSGNTPFTQYYKSIMSKAASRKMITSRKSTCKGKKKMQHQNVIATNS